MILTYAFFHKKNFDGELAIAKRIADYAVANKNNKKLLSSKYVTDLGLKSAIANQILRKYSGKTIKEAKNINLVIPNQSIRYEEDKSELTIIPLKYTLKWHPGKSIEKINQIEIGKEKIYISVSITDSPVKTHENNNLIGVDLNATHHIMVCANAATGRVIKYGKQGPNIRKYYYKKRKAFQEKEEYKKLKEMNDREKRRVNDLNHKMSKELVEMANITRAGIVLEDLSGIRKNHTKEQNVSKGLNRLVNSWGYYNLQQKIVYKAKLRGINVYFVKPHYTSQHCSKCHRLGTRNKKEFMCNVCGHKDHADVNAAFCIGKRKLGLL
jgi:putative transposase